MKWTKFILLFVFASLNFSIFGQYLVTGVISDENGIPIPSAKVFVKNSSDLRTIADLEGRYEMRLYQGEYYLVISSSGYINKEAYITVDDHEVTQNFSLEPIKIQDLENMSVSAKKGNPGRDIMLKVVAKRDQINPWNYPHSVNGYIKATEKIDRKEEKEKSKRKKKKETSTSSATEEEKAAKKLANDMNLLEVDFTRHYGGRNKVKEIRNAYELRGSKRNNLYYTTTVKSNFNFFQNLMHLDDLHQTPVSSPISAPGILSYKYRLEKQYEENGRQISKIKIIPRSIATTTLEGYIYIIDSLWLVQKLELTMKKGNLLIYDYFSISQTYEHPGDTMCVLVRQELNYGVKYNEETSTCSTISTYREYNFEPNFPPKFFNNELSVTEKEAYDKDSTFWQEKRANDLTAEEIKYIKVKDSIYEMEHRKDFLDSIDVAFNKVTVLKVLWWGIDHRNRAKKTQWTINSFAAVLRPIYIAGPRIAPGFFFFKKWDNEKTLDTYSQVSIGILNADIKGATWGKFVYDPFRFGTISYSFSHSFDVIRDYDAITQIYKRDNFIETTDLTIGHYFEILNGLYLQTDFSMAERRSLKDYKFLNTDDILPNNEPTEFESYQAFIGSATLDYTPNQKYMKEPNRKVVLGSKWPTFYLEYEKGFPKIFGSDVNHDYVAFGILQTFKIGTIGTSSYHLRTGKFINTKSLKNADEKFQRRSDPFWFSNPLYSFQGLDSTLPTRRITYEAHFVHHDNGAILNKLPFMKKTRIGLVFGGGSLYIPEYDWLHYEILAGLERNFKFSKRRLRIGVYGVLSGGNKIQPTPSFKISFAILDNRSMKWNF
ncbi:MAG: carboxypeptidase-like regulatory domain-containing protein [Fluviicola sp.]|nr:carboxypeptidase-like regulatory domain-containing protein [Fluviicola sp.]